VYRIHKFYRRRNNNLQYLHPLQHTQALIQAHRIAKTPIIPANSPSFPKTFKESAAFFVLDAFELESVVVADAPFFPVVVLVWVLIVLVCNCPVAARSMEEIWDGPSAIIRIHLTVARRREKTYPDARKSSQKDQIWCNRPRTPRPGLLGKGSCRWSIGYQHIEYLLAGALP
jgi:hypothetical protein